MIRAISKLLNFFLSHTNTHTRTHIQTHKLHFQLMNIFFHCLSPSLRFSFQSNPRSKDLFLVLRNTRSTINSTYGLLLFSRTLQDRIDTTVFKSFISSSSIFFLISLCSLNKTSTTPVPHIN